MYLQYVPVHSSYINTGIMDIWIQHVPVPLLCSSSSRSVTPATLQPAPPPPPATTVLTRPPELTMSGAKDAAGAAAPKPPPLELAASWTASTPTGSAPGASSLRHGRSARGSSTRLPHGDTHEARSARRHHGHRVPQPFADGDGGMLPPGNPTPWSPRDRHPVAPGEGGIRGGG